jgi:membrane-associated phospholipid phosphatase
MIRPSFVPQGFSDGLLQWIYEVDTGWNAFPSLHVGHSTLVALLCWKYRRSLFPVAAAGSLLISASTVLIKQHYVVDIPGGILLAWFCFAVAQHARLSDGAASAADFALSAPAVNAGERRDHLAQRAPAE